MVTTQEFLALAHARGIKLDPHPTDALYADISSAIDLVDLAEESGLVILGFEGFKRDGRWKVPQIDHIADYSTDYVGPWEKLVRERASAARALLQTWRDTIDLVDFSLDGLDGERLSNCSE